jgi:hypothetical protein
LLEDVAWIRIDAVAGVVDEVLEAGSGRETRRSQACVRYQRKRRGEPAARRAPTGKVPCVATVGAYAAFPPEGSRRPPQDTHGTSLWLKDETVISVT